MRLALRGLAGPQATHVPQTPACSPTTLQAHTAHGHGAPPKHLPRQRRCGVFVRALNTRLDKPELVVGDGVLLTSFTLYKQIAAIVSDPEFPGWLAPLHLDPINFVEWFAFASTLVLTWTTAAFLLGGYSSSASTDLPRALRSTSLTWLASMPVAAAQLVLTTAAESSALVGDQGWVDHLPLAARGPGEPFVTAAGVLGLMCMWRGFYCTHLDTWSNADEQQRRRFREAVFMVCVMAALSSLVLGVLRLTLSPLNIEQLLDLAASLGLA